MSRRSVPVSGGDPVHADRYVAGIDVRGSGELPVVQAAHGVVPDKSVTRVELRTGGRG